MKKHEIIKTLEKTLDDNSKMVIQCKELLNEMNKNDFDTNDKIDDSYLFLKTTMLMSPAQRGNAWEKHMMYKNNGIIKKSSEDQGDFECSEYGICESKISTTNKGIQLNMKQLRLWQDVDTYICAYIDYDTPNRSKFYILTKKEMCDQWEKYGGYMHGTKKSNENNEKPSLSLSIRPYSINSKKTKEWDDKFLDDDYKKKFFR